MKRWQKFVAGFATLRVGAWLIVNVLFHLDSALLKISDGRLYLAVGWNMLLLTTMGAHSGKARTIPLAYVMDEKNIVLIASNGGRKKFPAWYWNLRAHPEARVVVNGQTRTFFAREAQGAERARLWNLAVQYFAGYAEYQKRLEPKVIPLMVLTPTRQGAQMRDA